MATFLAEQTWRVQAQLEAAGIDVWQASWMNLKFTALVPTNPRIECCCTYECEGCAIAWDHLVPTDWTTLELARCVWEFVRLEDAPNGEIGKFVDRWGLPDWGYDQAAGHMGAAWKYLDDVRDDAGQVAQFLEALVASEERRLLGLDSLERFWIAVNSTLIDGTFDDEEEAREQKAASDRLFATLREPEHAPWEQLYRQVETTRHEIWLRWRERERGTDKALAYQRRLVTNFLLIWAGEGTWLPCWEGATEICDGRGNRRQGAGRCSAPRTVRCTHSGRLHLFGLFQAIWLRSRRDKSATKTRRPPVLRFGVSGLGTQRKQSGVLATQQGQVASRRRINRSGRRTFMSKRANTEGSVYQRKKDGRWVASVHLGYVDGKRQRRTFYGATQAEALAKLKKAQSTIGAGLPIPPERLTVGQLLDQWLAEVVKPKNKVSTYRRHSDIVRVHLKPTLGHIRLARLTPVQVQALVTAKLASGLSPRTVQYIRGILRTALGRAMRWGYVGINVAALTDPPKMVRHEIAALSFDEARTMLTAVRDHRLGPLFVTALSTGLRQGELLGVSWKDVDLDAATLRVSSNLQRVDGEYVLLDPKTPKSKRLIALPATAVTALRAQRDRQTFERNAAKTEWRNTWDLVFTTPFGLPLHGPTVTRQFQQALTAKGLERRRFHDLRHGAASIWLASGTELKVVQEALGHATISVTADVYGHLLPQLQKDAAKRMDEALRGAL